MHKRLKKRSSTQAKNSSSIHKSRSATCFYPNSPVKKIIFVVIILASASVLCALFVFSFFSNEFFVKSRINTLATDYYENFFYDNTFSNLSESALLKTMQQYTDKGFSPISLRELLLHDHQKNIEYADYILAYCDENSTYVKFYPTSPFDKKSFHLEFTYSCNF